MYQPLLLPALAAIAAALVAGLLVVGLITLIRRPPAPQVGHLVVRATVMAVVVAVVVAAGMHPLVLTGMLLAVSIVAWNELIRAVSGTAPEQRLMRWIASGVGGIGIFGGAMGVVLSGWGALALPLVVTRRPPPLTSLLAAGFATLFVTLPVGLYREMGLAHFGAYAFLFMVVSAHDAFAVGIGKLARGGSLWSAVSPNKTLAGSLGGWVVAMAAAVGIRFLMPGWSVPAILGLVTVISLLSGMGDLIASCVKRECGIKDFGTVIPTHGGMLDRFDSLFFAVPICYWLILWHG